MLAVKRDAPAAPANVPVAGEPIFAAPANYYGQAKYTLEWEAVADVTGYAIYRCSGAALFDQDRTRRQKDWAWADEYYPTLTEVQIQELASRPANQVAFRRVNKDPVEGTTYTDTFDGRGRGFYVYRVRSIDEANNLSDWSAAYPPVHIYDVTPPATPVITRLFGEERQITIKWTKASGDNVSGYFVYRTDDKAKATDWRQMELMKLNDADLYSVAVADLASANNFEFTDRSVAARKLHYYALVAVRSDSSGTTFLLRSVPRRVVRLFT